MCVWLYAFVSCELFHCMHHWNCPLIMECGLDKHDGSLDCGLIPITNIFSDGTGLSNCTAIRELYLAGNKISDVEGLHRLLKLAVLDLGFNKVTMAKALGQLVANYHSLLALNLVGNPVQANVGDDDMRKLVTGLLPQLTYLNKQPLKRPQRAREVATDSVARTALGGTGRRSTRKRASRRLSQSPGASVSRSASKGRHHLGSSLSLTARK